VEIFYPTLTLAHQGEREKAEDLCGVNLETPLVSQTVAGGAGGGVKKFSNLRQRKGWSSLAV
jgi:hypothetical protein